MRALIVYKEKREEEFKIIDFMNLDDYFEITLYANDEDEEQGIQTIRSIPKKLIEKVIIIKF